MCYICNPRNWVVCWGCWIHGLKQMTKWESHFLLVKSFSETHSIILSVLLTKCWRKDDHFCSINWSMNSFCSASTLERASYSILYLEKSRTENLEGGFVCTQPQWATSGYYIWWQTTRGHNAHEETFPAASSSLQLEPGVVAAEPLVVSQLISADF